MGTKYSSNTASGYNSTPPTDDGTQSEANKVKWSTIKNKLTDPIATQVNAINTDVNTALDYGPVSVVSAAVTLGSAHNNQFIELSGAATPTLDSSDGLGAGWFVDVKNIGTQVITVARERTNDTIDDVTADVTMNPLDYIRFVVNAAANGFRTVKVQKATSAQVAAGTASDVFITPEGLAGAIATQAEVNSHSDGYKYVTPATLGGFMGRGALVTRSTEYSTSDATLEALTFSADIYDTDGIWTSANGSRLTVPAGVSVIKIIAQVTFDYDAAGSRSIDIIKNGTSFAGGPIATVPTAGTAVYTIINITSPLLQVSPGDYFELEVYQNSGGQLAVLQGTSQTWFSMEIIK